MTESHVMTTPSPVQSPAPATTLRSRLEQLRASGSVLNLKQAVGVVVPICVQLADIHRSGHTALVHPASLVEDEYGFYHLDSNLTQTKPEHPHDIACLAPEQRGSLPGDARASVYAVGAILYELVTGAAVGPGMRRPSEIVPALPQELELVLSKALVSDPAHRPDDLNALAQALYNLAPSGSIKPPAADTSHLDQDENFSVDVSLSMLPQTNKAPHSAPMPSSPYEMAVRQAAPVSAPRSDQTTELAALKQRLESDPSPRYVVVKDGMDHGPFNAVEMLQQIAANSFVDEDILRDTVEGQERLIKEWPEFAPFAEHARLNRNIKAEKAALERVVVQESRSTRGKAFFGVVIVAVLLVGAGAWFLTARGKRNDKIAVQSESITNVETDAGLAIKKKKRGSGRRGVVGSRGGFPQLSGGMSCEAARAAYVEEMKIGQRGQADLTAGQYGSVLNSGTYFSHCGVPSDMKINICAAVQNGRAVGVTVVTKPRNAGIQRCIAGGVRRLSFPSHPKLDVTRTVF